MVAPLLARASGGERVLVGPETADDAGVYLIDDDRALVATVDFITPVCDDPRRFGRVAAANSVSDVYAMGGRPLFALNLCCFPESMPAGVPAEILAGGADLLAEVGAFLLGGHTVVDPELKYGMAVVGEADPRRLLTNAAAAPGDRLVLTKPLGTGVLINAFKLGKLDAAGLEPAMREMERVNREASRLALDHGAHAATDVTGFGLAGHGLGMARASGAALRIEVDRLPIHAGFFELAERGVTTCSTEANRKNVEGRLEVERAEVERRLGILFDPQTSGGLLVSLPPDRAPAYLAALHATAHQAADIGDVLPAPARLIVR